MTTQFAPRQGTKFAKGRQGDWFVDVRNGGRLPCLMDCFWMGGQTYHQNHFYNPDNDKRAKYVEAIRKGRVVMAKYTKEAGKAYKRVGYIERILTVTDVVHDPVLGLSCRIVGSEAA